MSIFEILMLVCFGLSWPISIAKVLRTRQVGGKSPVFLTIICLGYLSGIVHKIMYSPDWVIVFYVMNLVLVGIDLTLYFHFANIARASTLRKDLA